MPGDPVQGEGPQRDQHEAGEARDHEVGGHDRRIKVHRASSGERDRAGKREAGDPERPREIRRPRRRRGEPVRREVPFAAHERLESAVAVRHLHEAQIPREHSRQEALLPRVERLVGHRPHPEVHRQHQPGLRTHQPHDFLPVGEGCAARHERGADRAAERPVEGVADPRRTVVGQVVVVVDDVLRLQVPQQVIAQARRLGRGEREPLDRDRASVVDVIALVGGGRLRVDHVVHHAAGEVPEESALVEVEHPVVEVHRLPGHAVADLDRVVAEPLPVHVARSVGDQGHGEGRSRRGDDPGAREGGGETEQRKAYGGSERSH